MCLILFAYKTHPRYRLILAANRDEFYDRPTAQAHFWADAPDVLAGRDLVQGGTWLGVSRTGRFAAVTNFRDPNQAKGIFSRGRLVSDFLRGTESAADYLRRVEKDAESYTGFNLLVGDFGRGTDSLAYFSNRGNGTTVLEAGVYGLSNALLDSPWPKVTGGKKKLVRAVGENEGFSAESVFEILRDQAIARDEELPETGIGLERERILSSCFIETPIYGTRSTSVVLIGNDDSIFFAETSFHPPLGKVTESFQLAVSGER